MKQVVTKRGAIIVEEVPPPMPTENMVSVRTRASLISTGTEMSTLRSSPSGSLPHMVMKQPNLILMGLQSLKQRGFKKTLQLARGTHTLGAPLGYSAAGIIVEVGDTVSDLAVGDRVACAGAGQANHAEYIAVPRNLVTKIPDGLSFEAASSVTLGAIALQGVRQADPQLGETIVVSGLGLLGLLTVQLLKANGCIILGIDPDADRRRQALNFGALAAFAPSDLDLIKMLKDTTDGRLADRTIITAATISNEPVNQAVLLTRSKGTVVIVGAVGLSIDRGPFYEREIDLKISRSYGPGRYDAVYEHFGIDYPFAYVRWTENRNMQTYLNLLANGAIRFDPMISATYPIEQAPTAYASLQQGSPKPLAVVLTYPGEHAAKPTLSVTLRQAERPGSGKIRVAVIGTGNFATSTHLPNIASLHHLLELRAVSDRDGLLAKEVGMQFRADYATTEYGALLKDPNIDLIIITTRHHTHAELAQRALRAGKAVLLEKPMANNEEQLRGLTKAIQESSRPFLIGFNRRFSPAAEHIYSLVARRTNPLLIYYRMNAGYLDPSHWTQGPEGAGRIIGEACHIFDLFNFWTGSQPISIQASAITPKSKNVLANDNLICTLKHGDGSVCSLLYTGSGDPAVGKEYAEIYTGGHTYLMDDYRSVKAFGAGRDLSGTQDKGHRRELELYAEFLQGKRAELPITLSDLISVTETSFRVQSLIQS